MRCLSMERSFPHSGSLEPRHCTQTGVGGSKLPSRSIGSHQRLEITRALKVKGTIADAKGLEGDPFPNRQPMQRRQALAYRGLLGKFQQQSSSCILHPLKSLQAVQSAPVQNLHQSHSMSKSQSAPVTLYTSHTVPWSIMNQFDSA